LLAFLAALLDAADGNDTDRTVIGEFLGAHIEPWADIFAHLLSCSDSPYIALLGSMLGDLFLALRDAFPPLVPAQSGVAASLCVVSNSLIALFDGQSMVARCRWPMLS
jgi:hypothetical protein